MDEMDKKSVEEIRSSIIVIKRLTSPEASVPSPR